jgi:hypothetical protein
MPDYRIACQEDDGSWTVREFNAVDDPSAIAYGLQTRTCNRCELYCETRWLASFDGALDSSESGEISANDNVSRSNMHLETELSYFQRRARTQRDLARTSQSLVANLSHLRMAEYLESLARAIQAERRRLRFYDVNAHHADENLTIGLYPRAVDGI